MGKKGTLEADEGLQTVERQHDEQRRIFAKFAQLQHDYYAAPRIMQL